MPGGRPKKVTAPAPEADLIDPEVTEVTEDAPKKRGRKDKVHPLTGVSSSGNSTDHTDSLFKAALKKATPDHKMKFVHSVLEG